MPEKIHISFANRQKLSNYLFIYLGFRGVSYGGKLAM